MKNIFSIVFLQIKRKEMKKIFLITILLYFSLSSRSQESILNLKSGVISNITDMSLSLNNPINYCFLVFDAIPTTAVQLEIRKLGIEFLDYPIPRDKILFRNIIDAGADLVVGSQPHCVQARETYLNNKIFYSNGD